MFLIFYESTTKGCKSSTPSLFQDLFTDREMKSNILTSRYGFTLIELMIVVSIIGILATLATGSFLSYQARAKQAEAKTNLAAIGEMAVAYKTEHETYVTDWVGIGWQPNMRTRYRFWYSGNAAAGTPTNLDAGVDYSDPGSPAGANTFIAAAVGNIDRDTSADQWLVDQDRNFTMLQNDVTTP